MHISTEWYGIDMKNEMLTYTYIRQGEFALQQKPTPVLEQDRDAIVRVTLSRHLHQRSAH